MRSARNTGLVTALRRTGDGAAVIGSDGEITFWNAAAEDIFGCTSREVLGRPCWEVFVGCDDNRNVLCSPACHIMSLACRREPVRSFAYPNGRPGTDYTREHIAIVRDAGYSSAVTTAWGCVTSEAQPYELPRISPWGATRFRYLLRIARSYFDRSPAVA